MMNGEQHVVITSEGGLVNGHQVPTLHYQQHERLGGETQHAQLTFFFFFLSPILDDFFVRSTSVCLMITRSDRDPVYRLALSLQF